MSDTPAAVPAPRLSLQTERQTDCIVVRCSGRLTSGVTNILTDEVRGLIPQTRRLVLDLTDLTQMDSMGLGSIVSLYVSARTSGCHLELINLSARVKQLFSMTNLLSMFEVCGDQANRIP